jgi:ribosomal-protein-alanine N-acetyltransferase
MLIGKNVLLKLTTVEDAQLIADWMSDPNVLGELFNVWPESKQRIEKRLAETGEQDRNERGQFLICSRDKNERMGTVGYFNPFANKTFFKGLEIYYLIHPDFRNKGIATQTACLLVNHLFNATMIERIQATVVVGNAASCRVLEKAGMQKEGICRRITFLHGRYADLYLYSIVREDWKNEKFYRQSCPEF